MTKHTPGPWTAVKVTTHVELGFSKPPSHYQIIAEKTEIGATLVCELRPYGKDNDPNARLIAAAPDLLAALQAMVEPYDTEDVNWQIEAARAAIARATLS